MEEDSRKVLDKIFNEGEVIIPLQARKDFKTIYVDERGSQYYQDLRNSDLVYLNEYYEKFKVQEYTF